MNSNYTKKMHTSMNSNKTNSYWNMSDTLRNTYNMHLVSYIFDKESNHIVGTLTLG